MVVAHPDHKTIFLIKLLSIQNIIRDSAALSERVAAG